MNVKVPSRPVQLQSVLLSQADTRPNKSLSHRIHKFGQRKNSCSIQDAKYISSAFKTAEENLQHQIQNNSVCNEICCFQKSLLKQRNQHCKHFWIKLSPIIDLKDAPTSLVPSPLTTNPFQMSAMCVKT